MAISNIKAVFRQNNQKMRETITSLENYALRSDLSKIESAKYDWLVQERKTIIWTESYEVCVDKRI